MNNLISPLMVPKLEGSHNYLDWQASIIACLRQSQGWQFIEGTPSPPIQDPDEKSYAFQERVDKFKMKQEAAQTLIICTVSPAIKRNLAKIDTAKECWDRLESTYMPDGIVHQGQIYYEFSTIQYVNEPIEASCSRFQSLVDQCLACAIAPTPTLQILHFLQVLAPHFGHWTANKQEQLRRVKDPP
jgi:hypothetical protein